MAAIIENAQLVETPAPGRLRYGLFTAARVTDDLDVRGVASGFQFAAQDCGTARFFDANCETAPFKTFDEGTSYMNGEPYWIYATLQCGTVGRSPSEIESQVRRKLAAYEQRQVEAALWGGTTPPVDPALVTTAGVVTVTPAADGAGAAIAALEESFYSSYGYVGTIHMHMSAYAALAYAELISDDSRGAGALTTPMGSVWSLGAGYGITGPAGAAPDAGNVWAFMTPPVWIKRTAQPIVPDVTATMDRTTNQYMAVAERVYAHTWECPIVHAVQVPVAAPAVVGAGGDVTPAGIVGSTVTPEV